MQENSPSVLERSVSEIEDRIARQHAMIEALEKHRTGDLAEEPGRYAGFMDLACETLASLEASLLTARERLTSERAKQSG